MMGNERLPGSPAEVSRLSANHASVLIVDDREDNLAALEAILSDIDCTPVRASSGTDALERLLRHHFALILMDLRMPGMDGLETAKLIRQRPGSRDIPIILITASDSSPAEILNAYSAGAVDYVSKPVVPEILRAKVRTFLELFRKTEALRKSEEYTRLVLEKAFNAFIAIDAGGRIIDWNPQAEATFGWKREEILGLELATTIIPPRYREAHQRGLERFLATGEGVVINRRIEFPALHRDGHEFPVEITISTFEVGNTRLFTSFLLDISERRQAEAALREAKEVAEATSRELETFSYSVSHDLRAPLRSMTGFADLLKESAGAKLGEQEQMYLERLRSSGARMGELIDDLLSLAGVARSELHVTEVDLADIARGIEGMLRKADPARRVTFVIPERLPARGDARFLRVVLENLLGNAWKFTGKHATARIEVGAEKKDNRTVYFVRDDGAGFDMAFADKLFRPFQRLHQKEQFEGTGVGLATVARIVHRHGGRVWAEGWVEKGAKISFMLGASPARRPRS